MISNDSVQTLIGSTAYGPDGDKIGSVGQVYLDNDSGAPEWATVKTGLFGTKESFVPLRGAELSGEGVRLPYDKSRIKGAPAIDADDDVSPEEEIALYEYYGITVDTTGMAGTGYGTAGTGTWSGTGTEQVTVGHDVGGPADDATAGSGEVAGSGERVPAATETQEAARARMRKYVVSEHVTVPVTHEEIRVDREPVTDADREETHGRR